MSPGRLTVNDCERRARQRTTSLLAPEQTNLLASARVSLNVLFTASAVWVPMFQRTRTEEWEAWLGSPSRETGRGRE